jgi:hypothetical protein
MSEMQVTTERREPLAHEIQYTNSMAKLLSEESGIDANWIKKILTKTLPEEMKRADAIESDFCPARFLYDFKPCLFEAMKWLDKERVVDLFSGDLLQLRILEERYRSLLDEVQFVNFHKLLPTAKEFQTYLEDEFKSIISTGSPSKHFKKSYYLEDTFLQSFRPRFRNFEEYPESVYIDRQKQFTDKSLSDDFLKKILGPNFYREFRELEGNSYVLGQNYKTNFVDLVADFYKEVEKDRSSPQDSLIKLKKYLSENKLKVPANLEMRDEALRTSLHIFSQNALAAFIEAHRNHELGTILRKVWELICAMPYEQLDLIFNGNMSYLGIIGYDIDNPSLYIYGRNLIEKILIAAALEDASIHEYDFRMKIFEHLEPIIEDFVDPETGEIHSITYSLYQAIDLCGRESVMSACGKLAEVKNGLDDLRADIKKDTKNVLKISFDRLREIRREVAKIEHLRVMSMSHDGGITVQKPQERPVLKEGTFSIDYKEYRSRNSAYKPFEFTTEFRQNAIKALYLAYESGVQGLTKAELINKIYSEERRNELHQRKKNPWQLWDLFKDHEPAVMYGFITTGEKKAGFGTYTLDFGFEDRSPEEQLQWLEKQKAQKEQKKEDEENKLAKKRAAREALKAKLEAEGKKPVHPWSNPVSASAKKSRKEKQQQKSSSMSDRYPDNDDDDFE